MLSEEVLVALLFHTILLQSYFFHHYTLFSRIRMEIKEHFLASMLSQVSVMHMILPSAMLSVKKGLVTLRGFLKKRACHVAHGTTLVQTD